MNTKTDYYQILQVDFNADKAEIESSYRRLSKQYHPDISNLPQSQEMMSRINIAYATLSDNAKRQAYNKSFADKAVKSSFRAIEEAKNLLNEYFTHLIHWDYEKAYQQLCLSDRQRIGLRAFVEWREKVRDLYSIHEFTLGQAQYISGFLLETKHSVTAIKFKVDIVEKNQATAKVEHSCFTKYVVFEQEQPGVLLGYSDLCEITETLSIQIQQREQALMQENWQKHLQYHDRVTGLYTKSGLLWASKKELYRLMRYKGNLIIAILDIKAQNPSQPKLTEPLLNAIAQAIKESLRQTDMSAYLDSGQFAILFFELKKRHATLIVNRALRKAKQAAQHFSKEGIQATCAFEPYIGGNLEGYIERLCDSISK